jgi:2-polyprenyl-3-methyl-5-hydroxy-6-metoxy-1,4-benzoquinol methylase
MPAAAERKAAQLYRSVFVDLDKISGLLAQHLVPDARLIDIGGGDGELLNTLLDLRPDLHVTMVDVAPTVGKFVEPRHRHRIELVPGTSLEDHVLSISRPYDAALVSDVMHHLPVAYRPEFLRSLHGALVRSGGVVFVKDIEPGTFISRLSVFCDKYVSGDRGVMLISQKALRDLASEQLPDHVATEVGLLDRDRPNYLVKLSFQDGNS